MASNLANAKPRDWFRILRDLSAAGVPMAQVARKVGRDKCTVHAWSEGSEPRESDARVVLALYARHCPVLYAEHQKQFEILSIIPGLTAPGESHMLPFATDEEEV